MRLVAKSVCKIKLNVKASHINATCFFFLCSGSLRVAALEADGVRATGWNIWEGGTTTQLVPRSYLETEEKLLGKRGCIADRHSLARHDMCTALPPAQRIGAETRLLG